MTADRGAKHGAVGVIPARIGSTRLPGKMLLAETGKPLVVHVYEQARRARRLDDIVVATDDPAIVAAIVAAGGRARLTDPALKSGSDRIGALLPEIAADVIVNIQGDEPEIDPALLDALVERLSADPDIDIATAACPISQKVDLIDENCVKVVVDARGRALYFSRSPIPGGRGGPTLDAGPMLHVGVYAYRRAALEAFLVLPQSRLEIAESLEQLRLLENGFVFGVVVWKTAGRGIDTAADYAEFVRRVRESGGAR